MTPADLGPETRQEGLFVSPRERRLWLATGAVVVAIWTSLGFAGGLAERLASSGLLESAFALGFLVVIAVVLGHALSTRATARRLWATVGVVAAYAMVFVRLGVVERTHLFEYGLVAVLVQAALLERRVGGAGVRWPGLTAVVVAAGLGWVDEGIQALLPNRVYDLRDVGFNALAAAMAVGATALLRRFAPVDILPEGRDARVE